MHIKTFEKINQYKNIYTYIFKETGDFGCMKNSLIKDTL